MTKRPPLKFGRERIIHGLGPELVRQLAGPIAGRPGCPDGKHCATHGSGPFSCCSCGSVFEAIDVDLRAQDALHAAAAHGAPLFLLVTGVGWSPAGDDAAAAGARIQEQFGPDAVALQVFGADSRSVAAPDRCSSCARDQLQPRRAFVPRIIFSKFEASGRLMGDLEAGGES